MSGGDGEVAVAWRFRAKGLDDESSRLQRRSFPESLFPERTVRCPVRMGTVEAKAGE